MNAAAIKQVLKTLRQFKNSHILHDYQSFSLRYCSESDSFIIVYPDHHTEEFQDLDKCAFTMAILMEKHTEDQITQK